VPAGTSSLVSNTTLRTELNATGSAPIYACRAWVNFNGEGTVAIRASGNVSSITDLGTGAYQVNFTTAMPDANYGVLVSKQNALSNSDTDITPSFGSATTTKIEVVSFEGGVVTDSPFVNVSIFR
jgi:hypothetical protein